MDDEIVRVVRAGHRQSGNDRVWFAKERERTGRDTKPKNRAGRGGVEVTVFQRDARTAVARIPLSDICRAISIGVAQRQNSRRGIALHVYEYVAIRRDHDMAYTSNAVSEKRRAKSFWQLQRRSADRWSRSRGHAALSPGEPRNEAKQKQRVRFLAHGCNGVVSALFSASLAPIAD